MKHPITDILEKFEEGQKLYNTSSLFNKCVHYLANGGNIYHILEKVITLHDEQIKMTEEIVKMINVPIMFKYDTDK
jgi:hypothetical protein